ncbi:hypothetical protein LZ578_00455 [Jeotgalibaca sp. MA1X17-3]|uniref:hypothetical protein n=1 Tax=Jeotgalibaca sp. MA1X17-3 TaxID=2908211 RepID=UPI001F1A2FF2|nr:hypothetical protein [Jeotgalibaca sp. MA1X17-3]UJF15717.1 hypothetical protein LZ578_00455 [Jeotgalibaca sp. MA1X17-3]
MKKSDVYYEDNDSAYSLMMLFIALNAFVSLFTLNHMRVSYVVGVYVLLTIAISLFSFLIAVRLRLYQKSGMVMCAALLAVQLIRCFLLPEVSKYSLLMLILMVISVGILGLSLLITIKSSQDRDKYIEKKLAEYYA